MEKTQAEIEKLLLNHEKEAYKQLKGSYTHALADIKARVKILQSSINDLESIDISNYDDREKEIHMSKINSKVYQLNYQRTLEKQVGAIVDVLKQDTTYNVQTYLNKMYQDSFLGMQYHINAQGIPLITPLNPSVAVKVCNKKIEGMTYADRINVNMNDFKKTIKAEISRGLANGSSYDEIARNLSMVTGEDLYKSKRIVRTEGARVSSEAKLTSLRGLNEQGAELVKIWDSTLDGKTRETHTKLDQQKAEIDDYFKADGYEVMAPGMFGDPSQDCNCRCVLTAMPKDEIEDSIIKFDNELEQLVQTKNYEDWKQGYFRIIEDENLEKYAKIDKKADIGNAMRNMAIYKSLKECFKSVSLSGIEKEYAEQIKDRLLDLQNTYPINDDIVISTSKSNSAFGWNRNGVRSTKSQGKSYVIYEHKINFSNELMDNKENSLKRHKRTYGLRGSRLKVDETALTTVDHEYAHAIDTKYLVLKEPSLQDFINKYQTKQTYTFADVSIINKFNNAMHTNDKGLSSVVFERMKNNRKLASDTEFNKIVKEELGSYAATNKKEFLAEGFANMRHLKEEEKTEFIKEFEDIFNDEFRKVILNGANTK